MCRSPGERQTHSVSDFRFPGANQQDLIIILDRLMEWVKMIFSPLTVKTRRFRH
jgi:hypothetical protein